MAIQEVWVHGQRCECGDCDHEDSNWMVINLDHNDKNTIIKDQHGQMYIITPIPNYDE